MEAGIGMGSSNSAGTRPLGARRRLRIGFKLNVIGGMRMPKTPDILELLLAAVQRLGPEGLGHAVALLEDADAALRKVPVIVNAAVSYAKSSEKVQEGENAKLIDFGITNSWPKVEQNFKVESMGEAFKIIRHNNDALASLFQRFDLVTMPALGVEAYKAEGPPLPPPTEEQARANAADGLIEPNSLPMAEGMDSVFDHLECLNYSGMPGVVIRAGLTRKGVRLYSVAS